MAFITAALVTCIIGAIIYLVANYDKLSNGNRSALISALGELAKWAFVVGLAFWLYGK